jgi:hypothetical protein
MATYKIIGGDLKEYGPVSEETLRRWIVDGRANGQTRIRKDDEESWQPLSTFREFAEALLAQTGYTPQTEGAPPINALGWNNQVLTRPASLELGRCLRRSWELLKGNFGLLLGATFVLWIIALACQFIPVAGGIAYWLFRGVLYGGLTLIFLKRIRGQTAAVGEIFAGFSLALAQLLLVGVVTSLLSGIGLIFCLVPGIYLAVAWIFSIPLVADKHLEFWSAMELSRKVVTRVWFQVLGLLVLAFLPSILIYLFTEMKISANAFAVVQGILMSGRPDFERIVRAILGVAKESFPYVMLVKVCLLLNLPLALGALMYAYEDLFGARSASRP